LADIDAGDQPEVTVLLPVRDGGAWLTDALASVLDNVSVGAAIIIDDGSTDGAVARAEGAVTDIRVRSVRQGAAGIAAAMQTGLAEVRTPLIARMDADDISLPGRIDGQVAAWRALGADPDTIVACRVELFSNDGPPSPGMVAYCAWQNALGSPDDHRKQRFVEQPLCNPAALIPTALAHRLGGWREGLFPEDYDFYLRAFAAGAKVHKPARVGLRWRDHGKRFTRTDPRAGRAAIAKRKVDMLVADWPELRASDVVQVVGAGDEARRYCDLLMAAGLEVARVFDIHTGRVGGRLRGRIPIVDQAEFAGFSHVPTVVTLVGEGGRARARALLGDAGLIEGEGFYCLS